MAGKTLNCIQNIWEKQASFLTDHSERGMKGHPSMVMFKEEIWAEAYIVKLYFHTEQS